ncbi:MAG: ATPase [Chloroflexi bacterium]|nr:ATPase [Chloroflexota bacterium]
MLPNASPIGFTGTPIELTDKNTRPRKYGYPPDKQEKTTQTVLEQAAVLSEAWAAA